MIYKYEHPKYFPGCRVSFIDYTSNERIGTILEVRTHYDALLIAYHVYVIKVDSHLNRFQVKENKILTVLQALSETDC